MGAVSATDRIFLVPDDVTRAWGLPPALEIGDLEIYLQRADIAAHDLLRTAQAALLGVDAADLDRDKRLGRGLLRFEPWCLVPVTLRGATSLGIRVTSVYGPTGWEPDDPHADDVVRSALAAHVHPQLRTSVPLPAA
jgi:hypothetical protein